MKRLITAALALFSAAAFATTYVPPSLINPAGSTSGQAILSSGPSTAPVWGNIGLANLPQAAANTVLGNGTASTAAVTALAMPSCSASGNALKWTSAAGFSCGTGNALTATPLSQFAATTSAQLAGVISDETGTGALVFATGGAINPTSTGATTPGTGAFSTLSATGLITVNTVSGIKGTTFADSAQAGSVGEKLTAIGSAIALTANVAANVASIPLTAGDWYVFGTVTITGAGSTVISNALGGSSTTSATIGGTGTAWQLATTLSAGAVVTQAIPVTEINVSTGTTVYLVAQAGFVTSTCTAGGKITALRFR